MEMSASPASNASVSLRRKRAARIAAVQGLYGRELMQSTQSPEKLLDQLMQQWQESIDRNDEEWPGSDLPERAMLADLLEGVIAHLTALDERIAVLLKENWKQERMDPIMVATLRAACYELCYKPDRKAAIILNEYVTIASGFLGESELAFTHSALQRLAADARPAA